MIGTTLQHYRIVRAIGSGGMGEVYAAEDLRLHRTVALKILPPDMAVDRDRLERFLREAQAAAALNHPNVVTLFGVEESSGTHFLTMELVEGRTLADLLADGAVTPPLFFRLAIQLADAIGAAHDRGIVHRDLKPANVMVTPQGRVKVLDFGLAKLKREAAVVADRTTQMVTEAHVVLGTAAYMSPEQAEGRPVDARSDIFSAGVVLYEMATGTRPFRGETAMALMSSIIKDTPVPPSAANARVPRELDRVIRRCLAKDPAERYQHAVDLRHDLEDLQPSARSAFSLGGRLRVPRWALAAGVSVLALGAAALAYFAGSWRTDGTGSSRPAPRIDVARLTTQPGAELFPSFSPDGKWVVYAADVSGVRQIYLQSVPGTSAFPLTTDPQSDGDEPAFSPDGETIAYRSSRDGGGIWIMSRTGESPRRITRAGFRPTWSPDGTELAYTTEQVDINPQNSVGHSGLWIVKIATREARRVTEMDAVLPSWSPNNKRIAFLRRLGRTGPAGIFTVPVGGGAPVPVTEASSLSWSPSWSRDGRFLYFASDRGGSMNLWRVAIDEVSGAPTGEPEPITTPAISLAHPSISADGTRVAYANVQATQNIHRLTIDPVAGTAKPESEPFTSGTLRWSSPDPSPDGSMVAFYSLVQPDAKIFVQRTDAAVPRQITPDAAFDRNPRWSPDGRWIGMFSRRNGPLEVWRIRPDGSDLQQLTVHGGTYMAWSPDGSRIAAVSAIEDPAQRGIFVFDPDRPWEEQQPERLPPPGDSSSRFLVNSWSPDGERLVGEMDDSRRGIAVYSFATRTYERLTDDGEWPVWLPDSRRVLFVAGKKAFYVVDIRTKAVKKIFSVTRDVIGPPRLTRDGRTAYFSRRNTESDIWIVTMK